MKWLCHVSSTLENAAAPNSLAGTEQITYSKRNCSGQHTMLSYLTAETGFIRTFGNRSLLLIFLCALTRTGDNLGHGSVLGLTFDLNPLALVLIGPFLALFILISLKMEADTLLTMREAILDEASKLPRRPRTSRWIYVLFASVFLVVQYLIDVVPNKSCETWKWPHHFFDFSFRAGTGSSFCIGSNINDSFWIYPPWQTYAYLIVIGVCALLTHRIASDWRKARG